MPTYEYNCENCGESFEAFQSMKDAPLELCQKCGGRVKRVVSGGAGVIYKGKGFYNTDRAAGGAPEKKEPAKKEPACPAKESGAAACAGCPKASGQ